MLAHRARRNSKEELYLTSWRVQAGVAGISGESLVTLPTPFSSAGLATSNVPDLKGFLQVAPVTSLQVTVLLGRQDSTIPGHGNLFVINTSGAHGHPPTYMVHTLHDPPVAADSTGI